MSLIVAEHREYIADSVRLRAYGAAIAQVVRPGDVVLDLGCGTGILGLLACRAGARRVYAIDESALLEVARENARANGFSDRCVFVRGLSTAVALPERVDVVVADQLGPFGFEGGLWEYFSDARARHAKPSAAFVPSRVELALAPVESVEAWERVRLWGERPLGFDFSAAQRWATNAAHSVRLGSASVIAGPPAAAAFDPLAPEVPHIAIAATFHATRDGLLHGLAGWFTATLAEGVALTNSPLETSAMNRAVSFLPLARAVRVKRGDPIVARVRAQGAADFIAWDVEVAGERLRHSTFDGLLVSRESLAMTHPRSLPSLSARGAARLTVLTLCDGKTALVEIEEAVHRRHSDVFPTRELASRFVASTLASSCAPPILPGVR